MGWKRWWSLCPPNLFPGCSIKITSSNLGLSSLISLRRDFSLTRNTSRDTMWGRSPLIIFMYIMYITVYYYIEGGAMPLQYYKTVRVRSDCSLESDGSKSIWETEAVSRSVPDNTGLLGLMSASQKVGGGGRFGRMEFAGMSEVIRLHCWWKPLSNDCAPISNEHWKYPWAMR
jgi:hypothetical protein